MCLRRKKPLTVSFFMGKCMEKNEWCYVLPQLYHGTCCAATFITVSIRCPCRFHTVQGTNYRQSKNLWILHAEDWVKKLRKLWKVYNKHSERLKPIQRILAPEKHAVWHANWLHIKKSFSGKRFRRFLLIHYTSVTIPVMFIRGQTLGLLLQRSWGLAVQRGKDEEDTLNTVRLRPY